MSDEVDTGKPTQHRVLKQVTLALARLIETHLKELFKQDIPVAFEYHEPVRGKSGPAPYVTLMQYWMERAGDRNPDRVLCKTEDGMEYHRHPPLIMTARYAITAWAPPPDDQEILVAILRVLYDHPDLAAAGAKEEDAIHFEDKPTIDLSGRFSLDEQRFLSQAYQMPFRPAIRCDVLFRVDSERKTFVKRVKERVMDYRKLDG